MTNDLSTTVTASEFKYGLWGLIFGFVGIFALSIIFSPLAFILGLIGVYKKQYRTGFVAILFAILGVLTSPIIMALIGIGYLIFIPDSFEWYWTVEPQYREEV